MARFSSTKLLFLIAVLSWTFFSCHASAIRHLPKRGDLVDVPPITSFGYTVPLTGGETCRVTGQCTNTLPSPTANKTLKYLALARGTINYSCEGRRSSDTPVYISQATSLWDAAPLLPRIANEESFHTIIPQLYEFDYSKLANSSLVCIGIISTVNNTSMIDLFNVETFAVNVQNLINAPELPTVNLDWAFETSTDLEWDIYRVETVAGQPPQVCAGQNNQLELEYAAEYWLYHT